jgi:hypothetical protein
MVNRPEPKRHGGWSRRAIAWTAAALLLLWVTGVLLYLWPAADTAGLDSWQAGARRWTAALHGGVVWLACVFAGRWIWPHLGWIWSRHRTAMWFLGIATLTLLVLAACTGLALLYGPGSAHDMVASWHWWCAVAIPVLLAWHGKGILQRRRHAHAHGAGRFRHKRW